MQMDSHGLALATIKKHCAFLRQEIQANKKISKKDPNLSFWQKAIFIGGWCVIHYATRAIRQTIVKTVVGFEPAAGLEPAIPTLHRKDSNRHLNFKI